MTVSATDLSQATRELHVRTVVDQVFYKTPFVEDLQRRKQVTYSGGKYIDRLIDVEEIDDQGQDYTANEALTDARKDTLEKPYFYWKKSQMPLRYDVDEELQNINADSEIQLLDLSKHLVEKGHRAVKIRLEKQLFNEGSTTAVTDSGKKFLSLISALDHDATYGSLARSWSAGTRDYWQSADPSGLNSLVSSSGQDTAYNLTKFNLRKWINETEVADRMEQEDDLYIMMCPTLWDKLAAEMESSIQGYKPGESQNQGIRKMNFDGHQIVSVPYLGKSTTMKKWLFILNMRHWELRIHKARNFKLTDFKWQGDQANGYDFYLARILWAGNYVCWQPSANMWLSNVT